MASIIPTFEGEYLFKILSTVVESTFSQRVAGVEGAGHVSLLTGVSMGNVGSVKKPVGPSFGFPRSSNLLKIKFVAACITSLNSSTFVIHASSCCIVAATDSLIILAGVYMILNGIHLPISSVCSQLSCTLSPLLDVNPAPDTASLISVDSSNALCFAASSREANRVP